MCPLDKLCYHTQSRVWSWELCNWEIRTIISHLIRNTLRPQHSFLPLIAFPLSDWSKRRGRSNKQPLWAFSLAAVTPLKSVAWRSACSLSTARSSYCSWTAAMKISSLVGGYIGPVPSFFPPKSVWVSSLFYHHVDKNCKLQVQREYLQQKLQERETTLPSLRFVFSSFTVLCV